MRTFDWNMARPSSPPLGDHDVPPLSTRLAGRRVALLVCGGIAAMKTPFLARALRRHGADVTAFCTDEALRYVGRDALEWSTLHPVITTLTWRAEHLSDATPFHLYLVAPATYNTIGKVASGVADTVVTAALASALGRLAEGRTRVLFAPTMHGSMHTPILEDNVRRLAAAGVGFVTPRDDYGKHNLPDDDVLVVACARALSTSPLRGRALHVADGPGAPELADALVYLGAEVTVAADGARWATHAGAQAGAFVVAPTGDLDADLARLGGIDA